MHHESRAMLFAATLVLGAYGCGGDGNGNGGTGGTLNTGGALGSSGTLGTGGSQVPAGGQPGAAGGQPGAAGSTGATAGSSSGGASGTGASISAGGTAGAGTMNAGSGGIGAGARAGAGGDGGMPVAGSAGSMATAGRNGAGGRGSGGRGSGGAALGGSSGSGAAGSAGTTASGTCTASQPVNTKVSGSGPHKVTVETNSGSGIKSGTIFRPSDLGGSEKYPIFVWGEGGCSQDGLSNSTAMAEIASYGYFVVADGTPNGTGNITMDRSKLAEMAAPLMAYIDWAIAENAKPCSAYYQSLDTTKVASNGFSCGGLMSQGTVLDPRIVTWGVNSSGMAGADQSFYDLIHTPVLFVLGGPDDIAYDGGAEGYDAISKLDVPVMWFSKDLGHGGDLFQAGGGDFTKIDLAWLNWWLKGDETATGKGALVGATCKYCTDSAWEVKSAHVP